MSADSKPRTWDDGATYYSTSDQDERLSHEDLDECLEAHLDDRPRRSLGEAVADGVTVYAWRRAAIDVTAEAKSSLDTFVADLAESIADEYGDPDGGWMGGLATKDADEFKAVAMPALVALLATVDPWRCHVVGQQTFTADELLAWVREHNPQWLEGKA